MPTLPSSQFRVVYASLTEQTEVTVNGHVIGTWVPHRPKPEVIDLGPSATPADVERARERFNSRPFTPVPKKGK